MNKPKMTFAEGVRISWKREIERGDPWRIVQLIFGILYYGALHIGLCWLRWLMRD